MVNASNLSINVRRSNFFKATEVLDRYIQILHILKLRQFIVSTLVLDCVGKVLPFQVCLSARILASYK